MMRQAFLDPRSFQLKVAISVEEDSGSVTAPYP